MTQSYKEIKEACDLIGISLSELSRRAGVSRAFIERLKAREPKSLQDFNKLWDCIEGIDGDDDLPF